MYVFLLLKKYGGDKRWGGTTFWEKAALSLSPLLAPPLVLSTRLFFFLSISLTFSIRVRHHISKAPSLFFFVSFMTHVSQPYVLTSLFSVLKCTIVEVNILFIYQRRALVVFVCFTYIDIKKYVRILDIPTNNVTFRDHIYVECK